MRGRSATAGQWEAALGHVSRGVPTVEAAKLAGVGWRTLREKATARWGVAVLVDCATGTRLGRIPVYETFLASRYEDGTLDVAERQAGAGWRVLGEESTRGRGRKYLRARVERLEATCTE